MDRSLAQARIRPASTRKRRGWLGVLAGRIGPILIALAWYLYLTDVYAGHGTLSGVAVLLVTAGAVGDIGARRGYFHPLSIYLFFSGTVALYGELWMLSALDRSVDFFGCPLYVESWHVQLLAREQLVLATVTYLVARLFHLKARGTIASDFEALRRGARTIGGFWVVPYAIGLITLLYFLETSGGISYVLAHLADRVEWAEGRGSLVVGQYFMFAGVLLWFARNLESRAWLRYVSTIALASPVLLSGARHDILILAVAIFYLDERTGWRPRLWVMAAGGIAIVYLSTLYQMFRMTASVTGLSTTGVLEGAYKDLSMPVGYVVATAYGFLAKRGHPDVLALGFGPFLPDAWRAGVDAPNHAFTQSFFPGAASTYSFGVWGEANYVVASGYSFLYYAVLATSLSALGKMRGFVGMLVSAIIAGGALRLVKGGLTQGTANILMWVVPTVFVCLALRWGVNALLSSMNGEVPTGQAVRRGSTEYGRAARSANGTPGSDSGAPPGA